MQELFISEPKSLPSVSKQNADSRTESVLLDISEFGKWHTEHQNRRLRKIEPTRHITRHYGTPGMAEIPKVVKQTRKKASGEGRRGKAITNGMEGDLNNAAPQKHDTPSTSVRGKIST